MIEQFLKAGLLQFGVFSAQEVPFKLNLQLLASYPHILSEIAQKTLGGVQGVDRLICEAAAVPMGVAVSLEANIPLVYSLGTDQSGVYDLIGAYDVGHPAALIVHQWDEKRHLPLIEKAVRVGLEIQRVISLFHLGKRPSDIECFAVIDFMRLIDELEAVGKVPPGQAQAVRAWLGRRDAE